MSTSKSTELTLARFNGRWALLLKFALAANSLLIVPLMSWAIWVTGTLFELKSAQNVQMSQWSSFMAAGPRYTHADAAKDARVLRAEIVSEIERLIKEAHKN